tara:strand:+ start:6043 stop:6270 length:228 start_codon:yes stop_codon:yes gene_type:complete
LTSDTEQERQDLLSSFKASALAAKQKQATTTPVVPPHLLHGYAGSRSRVDSEIPLREKNSYAKLKEGGAGARFGF